MRRSWKKRAVEGRGKKDKGRTKKLLELDSLESEKAKDSSSNATHNHNPKPAKSG